MWFFPSISGYPNIFQTGGPNHHCTEDMFLILCGSTSYFACGTTKSTADQKNGVFRLSREAGQDMESPISCFPSYSILLPSVVIPEEMIRNTGANLSEKETLLC